MDSTGPSLPLLDIDAIVARWDAQEVYCLSESGALLMEKAENGTGCAGKANDMLFACQASLGLSALTQTRDVQLQLWGGILPNVARQS